MENKNESNKNPYKNPGKSASPIFWAVVADVFYIGYFRIFHLATKDVRGTTSCGMNVVMRQDAVLCSRSRRQLTVRCILINALCSTVYESCPSAHKRVMMSELCSNVNEAISRVNKVSSYLQKPRSVNHRSYFNLDVTRSVRAQARRWLA